jgi:hypothetical protein
MSREQGPLKGGRGAPALDGDLTPEAAMGGWRPNASELGSHPHLADGVPDPPHRPPHAMGMRPAAIAAGRRQWRRLNVDDRAEARDG